MTDDQFIAFLASATPLLAVGCEIYARTCVAVVLAAIEMMNDEGDEDPEDDPPPGTEMKWGDQRSPLSILCAPQTCAQW